MLWQWKNTISYTGRGMTMSEDEKWTEWKLVKESKYNFTFELIDNNEHSKALKEKMKDGKPHYITLSRIKIDDKEYNLDTQEGHS